MIFIYTIKKMKNDTSGYTSNKEHVFLKIKLFTKNKIIVEINTMMILYIYITLLVIPENSRGPLSDHKLLVVKIRLSYFTFHI